MSELAAQFDKPPFNEMHAAILSNESTFVSMPLVCSSAIPITDAMNLVREAGHTSELADQKAATLRVVDAALQATVKAMPPQWNDVVRLATSCEALGTDSPNGYFAQLKTQLGDSVAPRISVEILTAMRIRTRN